MLGPPHRTARASSVTHRTVWAKWKPALPFSPADRGPFCTQQYSTIQAGELKKKIEKHSELRAKAERKKKADVVRLLDQ